MQALERAAMLSIARGCAFGFLAIMLVGIALSSVPVLALKTVGAMSLLMASILIVMAEKARSTPYQQTEVWLTLAEDERPARALCQQMVSSARRAILLRFARSTALFSVTVIALALAAGVFIPA
jgi:hypothetical protein